MNVKNFLINTLESSFNYPVYVQGTIDENEEYPGSFITVWTSDTADNAHYDNETTSVDWYFNVIFYSDSPALIESEPPKIIAALKAAHFIPQGKGHDIPSDTPTHTGWVIEFIYKENL